MIAILQNYDMEPEACIRLTEVKSIGVAEKLAKKMLVYGGKFDSRKIVGEGCEKVIFYDPEQGTFDLYDVLKHKIFSFINFTFFAD